MNKKSIKTLIRIIAFCTSLSLVRPEIVYGQKIEEKKTEIEELETLETQIQESIKNIKGDVSKVSFELKKSEEQLEEANNQKEECEKNIIKIEEDIEEKKELMKGRIKFTYENPYGSSIFAMILTCKSWSDFLNIREYVKEVAQYDERMLSEYSIKIEELKVQKSALDEAEIKIKSQMESLNEKKKSLLSSLSEKKESLTKTEEEKKSLEKTIKEMEEYERRLEAIRIANEKAKEEQERAKEEEKENNSGRPVIPQIGEEDLLAAIIYCEAGNEPYEGMLAVGSVVLNRVNNSRFPNTITEVIYAPGQFTPVASGRLAISIEKGLVSAQAKQAAKEVLSGNITGNWLYFRRNDGTIEGQVISRQVFY